MGDCCSSEITKVEDPNALPEAKPIMRHIPTDEIHDSDDDIYGEKSVNSTSKVKYTKLPLNHTFIS